MLVLGFSDYEIQGRRIAQALSAPFKQIDVHLFPDGERRITLPGGLPERLILCRSLDRPNDKLIELLLTVACARQSGVQHITLVAPYLCYMRQDTAFHDGEAISQQIIGRFLADLFDTVITIDAHLHRIERLEQALPGIQAINLPAAPLLGGFLRQRTQWKQTLLVGPDSESAQWVEAVARQAERTYVIASKHRLGDHEVEIRLPDQRYRDRRIILIDDMISTGKTLCTVAADLRERGVASIDALVTHALFDGRAAALMHRAGIERIWSTDSVTHPSNRLPLDQLLADAVRQATA